MVPFHGHPLPARTGGQREEERPRKSLSVWCLPRHPCRWRNPGGAAAEFPQRAPGAGETRLAQVGAASTRVPLGTAGQGGPRAPRGPGMGLSSFCTAQEPLSRRGGLQGTPWCLHPWQHFSFCRVALTEQDVEVRAAGGHGRAGEGEQRDGRFAGSPCRGCALLLATLQAPQSPGSHLTNPFAGGTVGIRRQLRFHGQMSPSLCARQSHKVLCSSPGAPLAGEVVEAALIKIIFLRVPGLSQALLSAGTCSERWRLPGECFCQEGSGFPRVVACLGDVSRLGWHRKGTVPSMQQPDGCWGEASAGYP